MPASTTARCFSLKDITNVALRMLLGTFNVASMGIKAGSNAYDVVTSSAATFAYVLGGKFCSLTGHTTSDWVLANAINAKSIVANALATQYTTFLLCADASGNPIAVQGPVSTVLSNATLPELVPNDDGIPTITTTAGVVTPVCPIGYIKVAVTATNVLTLGTTSLAGTGVTTTFVNCSRIPVTI